VVADASPLGRVSASYRSSPFVSCSRTPPLPARFLPSKFTREALRATWARRKERVLKRKHREGDSRKPLKHLEFQVAEEKHAPGEP